MSLRNNPLKYPVCHKESRTMFGLFQNATLADVNVVRAGPAATVSPTLVRALLYLRHQDRAITVGELAEGLGATLGWASRIADELVKNGFVERGREKRDRRVVLLQMNKRALRISRRLWMDRERAVVAALGGVPPRNRRGIARFLQRLTTELGRQATQEH
jgi:DNA-binding MarR family transcriptional regulator